ncbi:MAG: hypothetical protein HYR49_06970 [Gammaproteobacteria bacterium]|nr:hypothetical protein [Gammaproteobacteria bacterium]
MSNDDSVISKGRFKGKKITFASTERIEEFAQIASEFMGEVFNLFQGDYVISDESDVRDFTEMGSSDTSEIWKRINEVYGVEQSDIDCSAQEHTMTPNSALDRTPRTARRR